MSPNYEIKVELEKDEKCDSSIVAANIIRTSLIIICCSCMKVCCCSRVKPPVSTQQHFLCSAAPCWGLCWTLHQLVITGFSWYQLWWTFVCVWWVCVRAAAHNKQKVFEEQRETENYLMMQWTHSERLNEAAVLLRIDRKVHQAGHDFMWKNRI